MSIFTDQPQNQIFQVLSQVLHVVYWSVQDQSNHLPPHSMLFLQTQIPCQFHMNINDIIMSEDCFKLMFSPHGYCNIIYINIGLLPRAKYKIFLFTCNYVITFFLIENFSISVHKTNLIGKDVSISTNRKFITDNFQLLFKLFWLKFMEYL